VFRGGIAETCVVGESILRFIGVVTPLNTLKFFHGGQLGEQGKRWLRVNGGGGTKRYIRGKKPGGVRLGATGQWDLGKHGRLGLRGAYQLSTENNNSNREHETYQLPNRAGSRAPKKEILLKDKSSGGRRGA